MNSCRRLLLAFLFAPFWNGTDIIYSYIVILGNLSNRHQEVVKVQFYPKTKKQNLFLITTMNYNVNFILLKMAYHE